MYSVDINTFGDESIDMSGNFWDICQKGADSRSNLLSELLIKYR